ncbi:MAG: SAM-dependent chlorinase/fluorinase [Candidatus Fermentibacteraceae bacterium]|nr:SAM-dependent chlorinase/fluorinase [Candidatus Fermentibacteraceae bacterium]MBN2609076.1 SAM-dependent chlorinase/fluorinase [Candidatus Fermentibacteraceae bacterium]
MSITIFILTDFGTADTYVAQMKGVLVSVCPQDARLVDLTHQVSRGSVAEGAFHLWASRVAMPGGSVVLAVVDPGVGTRRRCVIVRSGGVHFLGPDNGLFGLLSPEEAWELPEPPRGSSRTFHGRDLFAPCAGRVASDPGWVDFLEELDPGSLVKCPIRPPSMIDGSLEASVAHVDRFGNAILWIDPVEYTGFLPGSILLPAGGTEELHHADTYGDNTGLLYLAGSQGCMELALSGGSAGGTLGLLPGDRVLLRKMEK